MVLEMCDTSDYVCEMCNKCYDRLEEAEHCEARHKEKQDLHYGAYLADIEKDKLARASAHPEQTRLQECS